MTTVPPVMVCPVRFAHLIAQVQELQTRIRLAEDAGEEG